MNCAYCGHSESKHCKGRERHANYKDVMRMSKSPRVTCCVSRHCQEPICSCVEFRESPMLCSEVLGRRKEKERV